MKLEKIRMIFIIVFSSMLIIPLLCFNFDEKAVSSIDNRQLTSFPEIGDDGYFTNLSSYIEDRIGFRNNLIYQYAILNDELFDELVHPSFTYGKDGHVFFKMEASKVDTKFINTFVEMLSKIQNYCESRNVVFLYCYNPSKAQVYTDYLPNGYIFNDDEHAYLIKKLNEQNINYIDNTELLSSKSKQEQVFNVKYDAGHWNDLGAYYGTNAILEKLSQSDERIKLNDINSFNVNMTLQTKLPVSNFPIEEYVPSFENKRAEDIVIDSEYKKELELDEKHFNYRYSINQGDNKLDLPKLMFFQGSYLNSRHKFFESNFSEYSAIHNYQNIINFDYYYNIFKPEVVVFETAEYATNATYFNISNMAEISFNPNIDNFEAFEEIEYDINELITIEHGDNLSKLYFNDILNSEQNLYLEIDGDYYDFKIDKDDNVTCVVDKKRLEESSNINVILADQRYKTKFVGSVENLGINTLDNVEAPKEE